MTRRKKSIGRKCRLRFSSPLEQIVVDRVARNKSLTGRAQITELDNRLKYVYGEDIMACYSTGQVAEKLGITKRTLHRWLVAGKVAEPRIVKTPASTSRVWSERDLKRAARYKEQNYCKGRGRKKAA